MKNKLYQIVRSVIGSDAARLLWNIAVVYFLYFVCRLIFIFENWHMFGDDLSWHLFARLCQGGLKFDTSAIAYTNAIVILLFLLPLHLKENAKYYKVVKIVYVAINAFCLLLNMIDTVFFEFRQHRITTETFREFSNEDNLGKIFLTETRSHFYLLIILIVMCWLLWKLFANPNLKYKSLKKYYITHVVLVIVFGTFTVGGMRGVSFFTTNRPIAISFAHRYVENPTQTGIVLNTPFSIIRTIGHLPPQIPVFFSNQAELDSIFSPVHNPDPMASPNKKNVVILILESFSQEFVGALNNGLDPQYKGYTPFLDSLLSVSAYYPNSFANSSFSIDAPPAILASIPRPERSFVLTPYSLHKLSSLGTELKKIGYTSAFFLGAENESLGIGAFVSSIGFDNYYGINEYCDDKRFGGMDDYDGTWGIWDEEFLQYFCTKLGEMKQPFISALFTLTSHHPFNIPDKYKDVFPEEGAYKLCKCIRYSDYSLRKFFESASKQSWFYNTIFVLSADHTNSRRVYDIYKTSVGEWRIPILFYDPTGQLPKGPLEGIAQQIDIMPTVLNYLGYNKPYISMGKDLLDPNVKKDWAFTWHEFPQLIKDDYVLRMYEGEVTEAYNYIEDPLLKHNIINSIPDKENMIREMKAIMQSYMQRLTDDKMYIE